MTAVPVTRTFVAGEVVLASYFNTNINGPIGWLLAPAILEIRQTSGQTVSTGSFTALLFDTEDVDSTGMHSTVSNTSRATAVYPGWYRFSGGVPWTGNTTGRRGIRSAVNGTAVNASEGLWQATSASAVDIVARSKLLFLNVADYHELQAFQESGGNLATIVTSGDQANMTGVWESN